MDNKIIPETTSTRELFIERLINAPRERVWSAWTDPEQVIKWWGPNGFTNTMHEMNVKPGGVWKFIMHGPDGRNYDNKIIFKEVVKPERLVYKHVSGPVFNAIVNFEDVEGKTKLSMRMVFETPEEFDYAVKTFGAREGLGQTMNRLIDYVTRKY